MGNQTARRAASVLIAFCLCVSGAALAHSGRTDASGGHRDNKNASGLGSYHYHHGYEAHLHPNGVCPYEGGATTKPEKPKPKPEPVVVHASTVGVSGVPKKVYVDQPFQLTASISPANAQEKEVTWSSSDSSIASVTEQGKVTPLRAGTVKISAKTSNGVAQTLTLTIAEIPIESVAIEAEADKVLVGKQIQLQAEFLPENATNRSVTWTSSDETVLMVGDTGLVTGLAPGTATVTVTASGGKAASAEITCEPIPVTGVTIQFDESVLENDKLNVDTALQMRADVRPKDATDPVVTWTVSDETVADISESGMLVPKKGGAVTVTANCSGGIEDSAEIQIRGEGTGGTGGAVAGVVGVGVLGAGGWMLYKKKRKV